MRGYRRPVARWGSSQVQQPHPVWLRRVRVVSVMKESVVRCGTVSGHTKHLRDGEKPCDACAAAKAAYDKRWRAAPARTRISRLNARAQHRALKRLKENHESEYKKYYAEERDSVFAEAEEQEDDN